MKIYRALGTLSLLVTLTSCAPLITTDKGAQPVTPQAPTHMDPQPTSSDNTLPPPGPTQIGFPGASSVPSEKYVDIAKRELADLLTIPVDQITLLDVRGTTWPNEALGCPTPGKVYTQVHIPGHRIRLETDGQEYIFHTDLNGRVILCQELNPDDLESSLPVTLESSQQIGVPTP